MQSRDFMNTDAQRTHMDVGWIRVEKALWLV